MSIDIIYIGNIYFIAEKVKKGKFARDLATLHTIKKPRLATLQLERGSLYLSF